MLNNHLTIINSMCYRTYNLFDEKERMEALSRLTLAINKSWTTVIYVTVDNKDYYLYSCINGIKFESFEKLNNYYSRQELTPLIMELKLKRG